MLSALPADETYEKLGIASIPAVFVYGRDGKLVKRFDNETIKSDDEEFTYADITKVVEANSRSRSELVDARKPGWSPWTGSCAPLLTRRVDLVDGRLEGGESR